MGNPVIIEMMAREKMRDLQAEWKRLDPALNQETFTAKQSTHLLIEVLSGTWKKAVRLVPAWIR